MKLSSNPRIAFCYPSNANENTGTELLYSPLALPYLARHTPSWYHITSYDEYVGEAMDADNVEADIVAMSAPMLQLCRMKPCSISILSLLVKGKHPGKISWLILNVDIRNPLISVL